MEKRDFGVTAESAGHQKSDRGADCFFNSDSANSSRGPSGRGQQRRGKTNGIERSRQLSKRGRSFSYSLSEIGDAIANTGFQKNYPKIKISVVTARGGEHVSRLMSERRAGKFLADLGNLGNTSHYTLYQSKTLDPIASAFILPEVEKVSQWWQGKQQFIDPENRYILVYVGAPLFLVGYNTSSSIPGDLNPTGIFWCPSGRERSSPSIPKPAVLRLPATASFFTTRNLGRHFCAVCSAKWR